MMKHVDGRLPLRFMGQFLSRSGILKAHLWMGLAVGGIALLAACSARSGPALEPLPEDNGGGSDGD